MPIPRRVTGLVCRCCLATTWLLLSSLLQVSVAATTTTRRRTTAFATPKFTSRHRRPQQQLLLVEDDDDATTRQMVPAATRQRSLLLPRRRHQQQPPLFGCKPDFDGDHCFVTKERTTKQWNTVGPHHQPPVLLSSSEKKDARDTTKTALAGALLCVAMVFSPVTGTIEEARAGFGPSGGATTSPTAGVKSVNVEDLTVAKLQQLIRSTIDEKRLNDFQTQLDALIENINKIQTILPEEEAAVMPREGEGETATPPVVPKKPRELDEKSKARLAQAQSFQNQIASRNRVLGILEAQPLWFNFLAAFIGSVVSTLVMHPVDTVKTRLQVQSSNITDTAAMTTDNNHNGGNELFENIYEGLTGNILKEGPPSALYLGVYEAVKSNLLRGKLSGVWSGFIGATNPTYLLSIYLVAGAAGELVGSIVRAPSEAVKSLVQTKAVSSTPEAFRMSFMRPEGRQNTFRAWSSSIWRDVPFGAIQLAIFELIKAYILNNPNIDFDSSTLQAEALIGAFAGGTGAFLTNPADVITTRIITQCADEEEGCAIEPVGVGGMAKLIFEEGGLGAFFTGWEARVLYWSPAIAIFLSSYCSVRQLGIKLDLFG